MNTSTKALRWAALAALTIAAAAAHAASFDLNYAGSFDSLTTLGGTPLAPSTPFSITATFDGDPSLNKFTRFPGTGVFEITALSLTLTGYGTYTAVTGPDLNVYLAFSGAGLSDRNGMSSRVRSLFNNKSDSSFNPATPPLTHG